MIPAVLLVILIPAIVALPVYALRRARTLESALSVGACALVTLILAAPGQRIALPGFVIDIGAPLSVLGRELRVLPDVRGPIMLLAACSAILFGLTWRARQGWTFTTVGLVTLALLNLALTIRPFVFSVLAIVAASAMTSIMIQTDTDEDNLVRSDNRPTRGALRFLVIAVLSLPILLAASYLMTRTGSAATDPETLGRAAAFIAVGFTLLLGGFPIFTWTHPASSDAPPLTTAFIASITAGALAFVVLSLRQEFDWFNTSVIARDIFRVGGILTLLMSALTGWAQKSFGRALACLVGLDMGAILIGLSGGQTLDTQSVALGIAARAVSFGLMGFGLALLREDGLTDQFGELRGQGAKRRMATLAVCIGGLSAVGLPGTLGFLSRWASMRASANLGNLETILLLTVSIASAGIGLIRGISALLEVTPASDMIEQTTQKAPTGALGISKYRALLSLHRRSILIVGVGVVVVILGGLYPLWVGELAQRIASAYTFYR